MNREIKFRGYNNVKGWMTGYFTIFEQYPKIWTGNSTPCDVIIESIGQYTGLKDSRGNDIYEGDILEWVSCNPFSLGEDRRVQVYYIEAHFWCNNGKLGMYLGELLNEEKTQVIGNIYENSEPLK